MGNVLPQGIQSDDKKGKVILSDGTIHQYDKPLTAAELMLEYPQQVVVEIDHHQLHATTTGSGGGNNYNKKKLIPLPADKQLEMNKVYLMLPIKRGKKPTATAAALSSEEARRLLMTASTVLKSSKTLAASSFTGFLPLFARMCSAQAQAHEIAQIKRISTTTDTEEENKTDFFDEIVEGRPEFLSRQFSGKGWKPSLDTITEKNSKSKVRYWIFKN